MASNAKNLKTTYFICHEWRQNWQAYKIHHMPRLQAYLISKKIISKIFSNQKIFFISKWKINEGNGRQCVSLHDPGRITAENCSQNTWNANKVKYNSLCTYQKFTSFIDKSWSDTIKIRKSIPCLPQIEPNINREKYTGS